MPSGASEYKGRGGSVVNTLIWIILVGLLSSLVWLVYQQNAPVEFNTPYQAVLLGNGQYFGKIEGVGSDYPVLKEVYYIKSQIQRKINEKTKRETEETANILVKRGKECHSPDRMVLNADHILFIEPVNPGSTVAKLISDLKKTVSPRRDE